MKPLIAALLGAAALALCPAASAQSADSVNAAYQKGLALGVSPATPAEQALCGAYWQVWQESAGNDWEASFVEALDPALQPGNAQFSSAYWYGEAQMAYFRKDGDYSGYDAEVVIAKAKAQEAYDGLMLLMPEPLRIFETLATCKDPY